jgi:dihydroorotase
MQELKEEGAAGFSDDGNSVPGSKVMMLAMEYCRNLDMVIMEHCEDKEIAGDGTINEGWVSVRLGLKGIPSEAEEIIVARDLALAKLTGSRLHISHASTKGTVELIRKAKESGINVSAEVTPHHLLLTEETVIRSQWDNGRYSAYNTNVKVNPPLRTQSDVDALIAGLNEGIIDAIATDHAPHTSVDKLCEMDHAAFGISGLETAFGGLMILVHTGRIGLRTLIAALTCKPASILPESVRNLGSLAPGNPADVTLIDIDRTWRVNIEEFYSKGKNSPFNKFEFKGKVMATIYGGKIVYGEGCRQMENTNG